MVYAAGQPDITHGYHALQSAERHDALPHALTNLTLGTAMAFKTKIHILEKSERTYPLCLFKTNYCLLNELPILASHYK